jgi:hypothetical protein
MAHTIRTPHAAIKIWNYNDRVTDHGADTAHANEVSETIISTVSLMSIQTSKSKSDPVGTFSFILAPTRNWVATITPGSWCAILMSNRPITEDSFKQADLSQVKMFGRIDNIRVEVGVSDDGSRNTRYLVSGVDWGSMFNNVFYVDPLIANPSDNQKQQGNALFLQLVQYVLSRGNTPALFNIPENLQVLLSVFGKAVNIPDTTRIAKPTHNIAIPAEARTYFDFIDDKKASTTSTDLTQIVTLQTGSLNSDEGVYNTKIPEGKGLLDPFAMVGSHTLWSLLMDNCNHALNELYPEMRWLDVGGNKKPQLTLYSRIKPFSFQEGSAKVSNVDSSLRSQFKNVVTHKLNDNTITAVNAGVNWKDKFNFLEIKPDFSEFKMHELALKWKSQAYQKKNSAGGAAHEVFDREGFRPLIFSIKQLPMEIGKKTINDLNPDLMQKWVNMLQEWFFDTHRLLNGRIVMTGRSEYLPVGDNIMFDAGLVGISHNYNKDASDQKKCFVLGHVESVQHTFNNADGARTFQTAIQFVRGIIVDENKALIGDGCLDTLAKDYPASKSRNSITTVSTPTVDNPKPDNHE